MNDLEKTILEANSALANIEHKPFSNKAFELVKEKVSIYITELITESVKNSKKSKMDNVSASHVEKASEYLVSKNIRKFSKLLGTIGGVLLGATISNIISMTTYSISEFSIYGIVSTVILGIAGSFLIAINIFKE